MPGSAPPGVSPPPGGVAAPPPSVGAGGVPGGVAPPPFARPDQARPSDPFGGSPASPQQQVVKLEFDDDLVADAEIGRGTRTWIFLAAGAALLVGLGGGYAIADAMARANLHARTAADARDVAETIEAASADILQIQTTVNQIAEAAAGQGGEEGPHVAYEAVDSLGTIEQPFSANDFTGKNYNAFPPGVVHNLFLYLMGVERTFQQIAQLRALTAENRREALNASAAQTAEGASVNYAALLRRDERGALVGSLGFLDVVQGDSGPRTLVRTSRNARPQPYEVFAGQEMEFSDTPTHLLIIDGASSRGVLAEQSGEFGRFVQTLRELKQLVDGTAQLQGDLTTSFDEVLRSL
ncbi:MAG: hypothetical protein ACFCGT_12760 [Sandaracinaceae bacterium]